MRRYIGIRNINEKYQIEFYTFDESLLSMCCTLSSVSQLKTEYNGDIYEFYIVQNNGIIPVSYPLISNYQVEHIRNMDDLFSDVVAFAKQIEYLKYYNTSEKRINYSSDTSHKNRVGNLSLEIMFDDKIIDMFERGDLVGYFHTNHRTLETDNLINSFLDISPVKKITNWLLTDACAALIDTYTNYKEHIKIDDLYRNVKTQSTIVYDPSFDGTLESYMNIQEKYQELNLI